MSPATWVNRASGLCEWVSPPKIPPPVGMRMVSGAENWPAERYRSRGRLRHDLVVGRIHVVGELDLDARSQPERRHADRGSDDRRLVDRRVEASAFAESLLQTLRAPEHATERSDVLAEDDDGLVGLHGQHVRVQDGLDHRPGGHVSTPPPHAARGGARAFARTRRRTSRPGMADHHRATYRATRLPAPPRGLRPRRPPADVGSLRRRARREPTGVGGAVRSGRRGATSRARRRRDTPRDRQTWSAPRLGRSPTRPVSGRARPALLGQPTM